MATDIPVFPGEKIFPRNVVVDVFRLGRKPAAPRQAGGVTALLKNVPLKKH